jgi:type IV pilus assembly protein PilV
LTKLYYAKGFTLIEVLVAMLILAAGLLGVAGLTIGIIKGNLYSKNVTSATVVADQMIEGVQRVGYTNADTLAGTDTVSMGGTTYTRVTTISDATPAANMKTVTVSVSWNPGGYSISLNTIISQ